MPRRRLLWKLFPSYLAITAVALAGVAISASLSFKSFYLEDTRRGLESTARLIASRFAGGVGTADDETCRQLAQASSTRLTIVLPSGRVVGDSEEDSSAMDNHANRPEIIDALSGESGTSGRLSHTLQKNMMYVAVPVEKDGRIVAVVRASVPLRSLGETIGDMYLRVILAAITAGVLAIAVSLLVSRRMNRPLQEMRIGAERFAAGDFGRKLALPESEEMAALAESMNRMASELDERIRTVTRQKNEWEAILTSMLEGVIAVDSEKRIISTNRAAAAMLGIDLDGAEGRAIHEVVSNSDLLEFVAGVLSGSDPVECDLVLRGDVERQLQVHGAALRDTTSDRIGAVVVLNDVTRLRRLERVRQEFVANVSHELRTPVTSIKGFVETLRDGRLLTGSAEPEKAEHFLGIIARQADRLNAIIEDLLLLASVEKDAESGAPAVERVELAGLIREAVEVVAISASGHSVAVEVDCESDLVLEMNPLLMEQAIVNLVDNAIKYSDPGGTVAIAGRRREGSIEIAVSDRGLGIAPDKLPRLFERFYRVDKARSRKLGGTGLGLAIVKHIAEAHGGRVTVESTPGEGSTFTIHLPTPA